MGLLNEFLNNPKSLELKETNPVSFISFLYIVYNIKKEYPLLNHFSLFQFNSKIKYYRKKDDTVEMAHANLLKVHSLSRDFDQFFKEAFEVDEDEIKKYLVEEIVNICNSRDYFASEMEKLLAETTKLSGNDDLLVISTKIPRKIFMELRSGSSITFTFFSSDANLLSLIYFELKGINTALVDSVRPVPENNKVFNNIIIFPPYRDNQAIQAIQLSDKRRDINTSFEWKMINDVLDNLSPDGNLTAIIQSGILNKVSDYPSRKSLIDQKLLKLVVELPRLSNVAVSLSVLFITHNNPEVSVINASKFASNIRRGVNIDEDKVLRAINGQIEGAIGVIDTQYLKDNSYDITPHRFFEIETTEYSNVVPLSSLVSQVFRGFQIPSEMLDEYLSDTKTRIKLLTLSSIEDGAVIDSQLQSLKGLDKKMEHYVIEKNDLVISCKGKTFKTAVIDVPHNETYVSTGSLIVIRCNPDKIDPTFLKIYLDSDNGIAQLKHIQTGTNVLSLNPTQLLNIQIPLPNLSKQLVISSQYRYKMREIQEVKNVMDGMKSEAERKYKNISNLLK